MEKSKNLIENTNNKYDDVNHIMTDDFFEDINNSSIDYSDDESKYSQEYSNNDEFYSECSETNKEIDLFKQVQKIAYSNYDQVVDNTSNCTSSNNSNSVTSYNKNSGNYKNTSDTIESNGNLSLIKTYSKPLLIFDILKRNVTFKNRNRLISSQNNSVNIETDKLIINSYKNNYKILNYDNNIQDNKNSTDNQNKFNSDKLINKSKLTNDDDSYKTPNMKKIDFENIMYNSCKFKKKDLDPCIFIRDPNKGFSCVNFISFSRVRILENLSLKW
jgi:hypothetical protein